MSELKLTRYKQNYDEGWYCPWPDGEWVKWGDVKILLSHIANELGIIYDNLDNDKDIWLK